MLNSVQFRHLPPCKSIRQFQLHQSVNDPTVGGVKSNLIDIRQVPILIVLNFTEILKIQIYEAEDEVSVLCCFAVLQAPSNAAGLAESEKKCRITVSKRDFSIR